MLRLFSFGKTGSSQGMAFWTNLEAAGPPLYHLKSTTGSSPSIVNMILYLDVPDGLYAGLKHTFKNTPIFFNAP